MEVMAIGTNYKPSIRSGEDAIGQAMGSRILWDAVGGGFLWQSSNCDALSRCCFSFICITLA